MIPGVSLAPVTIRFFHEQSPLAVKGALAMGVKAYWPRSVPPMSSVWLVHLGVAKSRLSPPWLGTTTSEQGVVGPQPRYWFCTEVNSWMSAVPVPSASVVP